MSFSKKPLSISGLNQNFGSVRNGWLTCQQRSRSSGFDEKTLKEEIEAMKSTLIGSVERHLDYDYVLQV